MKETIKKLRELAKLFLTEEQANTIDVYIKEEKWNALRLFVSDLEETFEIRAMVQNNQEGKLEEWLMIEELNDIVIELAIQTHDVNEKQPRRRIIRS